MSTANKFRSEIMSLHPNLPLADVEPLTQIYAKFEREVALAAGAAVVERCIFVAERPCVLTEVYDMPQAALAKSGDDINFMNVIANKRPVGAPGTPAVAMQVDNAATGGVAWTAFTKLDLTTSLSGTLANLNFAVGDALWVTKTVDGTGGVLPVGCMFFKFEVLSD